MFLKLILLPYTMHLFFQNFDQEAFHVERLVYCFLKITNLQIFNITETAVIITLINTNLYNFLSCITLEKIRQIFGFKKINKL